MAALFLWDSYVVAANPLLDRAMGEVVPVNRSILESFVGIGIQHHGWGRGGIPEEAEGL